MYHRGINGSLYQIGSWEGREADRKTVNDACREIGKRSPSSCRCIQIVQHWFGGTCPLASACKSCIKNNKYTVDELKEIDDIYMKRRLRSYINNGKSTDLIQLELPSLKTRTFTMNQAKRLCG